MKKIKLIKKLAKEEGVSYAFFLRNYKKGQIAILKNKKSKRKAVAVGKGLSVKINANIGASPLMSDLKKELKKLSIAQKYGADTVMDLTCGANTKKILREVLKNAQIPVGTVPVYEVFSRFEKPTPSDFLSVIEEHLAMGVDFITVHCGVRREVLKRMKKKKRTAGIVSRGGGLLLGWMAKTGKENPLFEYYDRLLEIAKKYDAVLSLGDGLRPGAISDANDWFQLFELKMLGKLAKRAWEKGVEVMIEGPGHIPLNQIEKVVRDEKSLCHGAPFYVLGPLPTDIAAGFDHITSAIGGALAGMYGADFLCYVTPAEHLDLPEPEDVKIGVIASKIAAHIADIARGRKQSIERDLALSEARFNLDWKKMKKHLLVPEVISDEKLNRKTCTMCGEFCPIAKTIKIIKNYEKTK